MPLLSRYRTGREVPAGDPHIRVVTLHWTVLLVGAAASGVLGASGAALVAVLHNLGTVAVMANAGRLLRFQDERRTAYG